MDGIGVARRYTDLREKVQALVYNPDPAGDGVSARILIDGEEVYSREFNGNSAQCIDPGNEPRSHFVNRRFARVRHFESSPTGSQGFDFPHTRMSKLYHCVKPGEWIWGRENVSAGAGFEVA